MIFHVHLLDKIISNICNFSFETENGISRTENGHLKNVGKKAGAVMSGSYSYTGPDGIVSFILNIFLFLGNFNYGKNVWIVLPK